MHTISDFLLMSDNHLLSVLKKTCLNIGACQTDRENYLYLSRPESKVLLVAHIDTVCRTGFKRLVQSKHVIRNVNGILGADDRAGCFLIYTLLNNWALPVFDVLFTNYEETGGQGAKAFIRDKVFKQNDIRLFIELDRKGKSEYVTYNDLPHEVAQYIESFGFKESYGTYSDIYDLTDTYKIPSVNLSVGYYDQHTPKESLNLKHMDLTLKRLTDILRKPIPKLHKVKEYRKNGKAKNRTSQYILDWAGYPPISKNRNYSDYDYCSNSDKKYDCPFYDDCYSGNYRTAFYNYECLDCELFNSASIL